ncbi:hypothetical protein H0H87_006729 [Tephrocybe sp. NHM501043]|nr:hypothetical protein H0H87_006729 [Tephrocybe sp. NHM501043]
MALTHKQQLAVAFVLAGYVALRDKIWEVSQHVRIASRGVDYNPVQVMTMHAPSLPIFWGHGRNDERLKIDFSLSTAEALASSLGVPFNAYTGRLGAIQTPMMLSVFESDSDSFGSMEPDPLPPPIIPSLAEALGAEVLKQPGVRFVTYEGSLGHWMNEAMLQDLGVYALIP